MTPLAGLGLALIAGWIIRDSRRAAALILIPYLAVVAAQTWGISDGRGVSPPSTVWPIGPAISYYIVQAIILALSLGVAMSLAAVRAHRFRPRGGGADLRRRTVIAATIAGIGAAAYITGGLLDSAPVAHHSANGSPPIQGVITIGVLLIGNIVLGVLVIAGRRSAARADRDNTAQKGSTIMTSQAGSYVAVIAAIGAAAALTATAGLSPAKAATAAPTPAAASSGVIHIYEVGTSTRANHDVITGLFTDHGVDHLDALDHGTVNKIVLTKGSFEANVAKLHSRLKVISDNSRTCSLVLESTAPVGLSHGTGSYRGIHGTLNITVVNAVIFPKKNGRCVEDITKPVRANVTSVTGSGRVTL